jgi:hypothetical protein
MNVIYAGLSLQNQRRQYSPDALDPNPELGIIIGRGLSGRLGSGRSLVRGAILTDP